MTLDWYYVCQRCHRQSSSAQDWSVLIIRKFELMICPECSQIPGEQLVNDLNLTEHIAIIEGHTK